MKVTFFISMCILLILSSSCKKAHNPRLPVACFEYSPANDIERYDTIQFICCSENSNEFFWDFGDNSFSDDENVEHVYKKIWNIFSFINS